MTPVTAVGATASQGPVPGGLGTLRGHEVKIVTDPEATPRSCKARSVPYALRDKVDAELSRLVEEGTLEPVQFADWAAPIMGVLE